ncbi:MAG: hypothetical protein SZ59_C0002G0019 [candidate division TM6 bacterium GW2011_GWF2_28_16]|nr:MAG: hypothetical protein SZ59_C0002G0019 [candidate division TM6 bacterium GW2011_GWF2_28_16]
MNKQIISLIKLLCTVYLVVIIPKIISNHNKQKKVIIDNTKTEYITSLENLIKNKASFYWLKNQNLALFCENIDTEIINTLINNRFKLKQVFILNNNNNNIKILNKNIKILTWDNYQKNNIKSIFKNIDSIIFNVKNTGLRGDNCFNNLLELMELNLKINKKMVILDQPNPVAKYIEGPGQIPLQHGLTTGELAQYFNNYILKKPINLSVIPMIGWQRANYIDNTENTQQKMLLSLLNEIKPINLNLDNTLSSQALLFPKNSLTPWEINRLKLIFSKFGLDSQNYFYKDIKNNIELSGVKINKIHDLNNFSYFNSMLTVATFLKNRKNIKLNYSDSFYKILASKETKDFLMDNINYETFRNKTEKSLQDFYVKSKSFMLYKPYPEINNIKILKI